MTQEEALADIGGIVRAARAEALMGGGTTPCGDVLRHLARLTEDIRNRDLEDDEARDLFVRVTRELKTADAALFDGGG